MGKMLYQGHVTKIMGAPGIFKKWSNFHDWNPTPMSSQTRKSANLPKLISEFMVKNIYAEYPEFTIGTSTDNIMEVLERSQFAEKDKKLFETQINLGGRFTTFYIEDRQLYLKYITADRGFITNEKNGIPHEAVFYTEFKREETQGHQTRTWWYTLLEWHYEQDGVRYVKNELYRSAKKSLFEHNYTNRIAEVFGELVDSEEQVYNIDVPTFVYGTNPINNNVDMRSREGIGAFINCIDALMVVDEAFDTISNELVGGRLFKTIPEGITDQVQDTQSGKIYSSYDNYAPDVITYEDDGVGTAKEIGAFAPILRIESQVQGFNVGIDMVSTSIGISSGTFRHDGKTIVTATQVLTDKDDTSKTIKTYETSIERYYQDIFLLIKLISNNESMLSNIGEFERKDISVMWKDSVITDDEAKREEDRTIVNNFWMPPTWYLEKYGYAEDETDAIRLYDLAQEMKRKSEEIIFPDDDLIDTNNPDAIVGVEDGKESVEEVLLNGAQITAAAGIIKDFNDGALSRDGAMTMLMTFLNIDQDKASVMLDEANKAKLDADRTAQEAIKAKEVVETKPTKVEEVEKE
jgi:A118 family predicted phage portal protein